ncbi:MAG: UPF0175 family protein [Anaerolineae bacterium]|nr:UPF0175 family protein [Anaerolineae bacterium]
MSIVIPDEVVEATGLSENEFMRELAVFLFEQDKLTLAQAAQLAEMTRLQFQHLLSSRRIPVHYDVAEFEADLDTLRELRRL